MAFLSSERFCVKSQRRRNTLCQSRLEQEWKTRLEGRGGAGTWAFVLFTLEMKLSPANLAFRKKSSAFFPLFMLFPIVLKTLHPSSYKNVIVEKFLNYLVRYFLAGNVIESWATWAMIYEQLLEDDKPTMWRRRVLEVIKTLRTSKELVCLSAFLYLWTVALAWITWFSLHRRG